MVGHTTMTCPHRVATQYGVVPAPQRNTHNALEYVFQRQLRTRLPPVNFFDNLFFLLTFGRFVRLSILIIKGPWTSFDWQLNNYMFMSFKSLTKPDIVFSFEIFVVISAQICWYPCLLCNCATFMFPTICDYLFFPDSSYTLSYYGKLVFLSIWCMVHRDVLEDWMLSYLHLWSSSNTIFIALLTQ